MGGAVVAAAGGQLRGPRTMPSASSRKAAWVMISAGPSGFLLSRMAMRPGRWATSTQLLPPPDDLVLLRQVTAERSAGAVELMALVTRPAGRGRLWSARGRGRL